MTVTGGTNKVYYKNILFDICKFEALRPGVLECGDDGPIKLDTTGLVENSPGFSDISDEVAPTLEKEEVQ